MKTLLMKVALISVLLTLGASGAAWAHVVVEPEEVEAGGYEKLTVSVPTENQIPTTAVRVEVPEVFMVSGVKPVPGWSYEFEKRGGLITAVTWTGGEILPREFQEFTLQAKTPDEPGDYSWKAYQTYEDGSVVEWTGAPDSAEPASVVEVVPAASQGSSGHGTHEQPAAGTVPDTDGVNPAFLYGLPVLGVASLVAALAALRKRA